MSIAHRVAYTLYKCPHERVVMIFHFIRVEIWRQNYILSCLFIWWLFARAVNISQRNVSQTKKWRWNMNAGLWMCCRAVCIMSVTVDRLSHLWLIEFSWWNSCWEALERPQTNPEEKPVLLRVLYMKDRECEEKTVCVLRVLCVSNPERWDALVHVLRNTRASLRTRRWVSLFLRHIVFYYYYLQICKRNYPE